jgi:antitoxin component of MazEF toxin-antitoxin module
MCYDNYNQKEGSFVAMAYRKLSKFGNNFGITFPKEMIERRQAKQGDLFEMVEDGENIIIRRVKTEQKVDSDYSWIYDEILKDLVAQGYEGEELVGTFQRIRQEVRPAVKRMLAEAEEQALKTASDPNYNHEQEMREIFGDLYTEKGEKDSDG